MGRTKIRWKYVGRVAAGVAPAIAAIFLLPGLLAPPEPPPLPDDIGVRTGATGAFAQVPAPAHGGDTRGAGERASRSRRRGDAKRRDHAPAAERKREGGGGERPDGSAPDSVATPSAPGPARPPSVATTQAPSAFTPTAAPPPPAAPPPIPETGSSSSGPGPNGDSGPGSSGDSGSAANPGGDHSAPPSTPGPTQFSFEH